MERYPNRLLQALSPESFARLLEIGRRVKLPQGSVLFSPGLSNLYCYFLTSGVASQVVSLSEGGSAEIGMQGTEGVIGAADLLGSSSPVARCFMQVDGAALRVHLDPLRQLFNDSSDIRGCILESLQQQTLTLNQIAACNKLHRASERLARWLLTVADRTGLDSVCLTQESLAAVLGTRRATVALVAGSLQHSGMIRYRRGIVTIVDREALAQAACDCYGITKMIVANLYKPDRDVPRAAAYPSEDTR